MSFKKNCSLVLQKKGDLQLEDRPVPKPNAKQLLIAVQSVGICGSDVKCWNDGRIGDTVFQKPFILGHEPSGLVVGVGSDAKHFVIGDRVAIEPGIPCRRCFYCKDGRSSLCCDDKFLSYYPTDGTLSRFVVHNADLCHKLPNHVSFDEGALVETLAVGIHACRRGGVQCGHKVLVCGAGSVGLMTMFSAKAMGAARICVTDIIERRTEFAKKMGSDCVLNVKGLNQKQATKRITELLGGMPDVTIECSGAEYSVQLAVGVTRKGGCVTLIGFGKPNILLPVTNIIQKELTIKTGYRFYNTYPTAIDLIASGKLKLMPLVTHRFSLSQGREAFEVAKSGIGIKVIIDCSEEANETGPKYGESCMNGTLNGTFIRELSAEKIP